MPQTLLVAEQVTYERHGQCIVHDVSLRLQPAEIVSLIGPNGAGKTTLVRLLLGLVAPTHGRITRKSELRVAYLPQRFTADPVFPMSVQRFLDVGVRHSAQMRIDIMREIGIEALGTRALHSLSGGELQRTLLARCLLQQPEWLVLDEPAQGVDVAGQQSLYSLIARIRDRYGCGILMVSHDLHLVMSATDQVVCLNRHICCSGRPESIRQHPEFLQLFGPHAAHDADGFAVYTHEHNHHHDLHGDVVDEH
ncbi:MAG: metal ABC transporter ATP-binding protein [Gammaproteobacteria bacterium]|nr:metal ABC transporter ATP-binding protein [Gammaproteobacteria bacterium]